MDVSLESAAQDCFSTTKRSKVRRGARRACYKKADVFQLVDDLKLAHIGFVVEGKPVVIPITLWRYGEALYVHTANKSRLHCLLERGDEICVSLAESSEWVMSKSAMHHSVNYRSAVLYCVGERVLDVEAFDLAFAGIINDLEEGRWQHIRPPNESERHATALMKLSILEGSFKSRAGGPNEDPEDLDRPVWNGTLPITLGCPFHQGDASTGEES